MITEKRSLKKITMTAGIIAMTVGLVNSFSFEAHAASTTGGTQLATVGNCRDDNGDVYGYNTFCNSGKSKCVATTCDAQP